MTLGEARNDNCDREKYCNDEGCQIEPRFATAARVSVMEGAISEQLLSIGLTGADDF